MADALTVELHSGDIDELANQPWIDAVAAETDVYGGSMNYAGRLEKVSASVARWKSLLGLTNVLRTTLGLAPAAYDDYGHGTHVAVGVCVFASFAFPRLVNPLRTSERRYSNPLT